VCVDSCGAGGAGDVACEGGGGGGGGGDGEGCGGDGGGGGPCADCGGCIGNRKVDCEKTLPLSDELAALPAGCVRCRVYAGSLYVVWVELVLASGVLAIRLVDDGEEGERMSFRGSILLLLGVTRGGYSKAREIEIPQVRQIQKVEIS
jgi:hypothetical protein